MKNVAVNVIGLYNAGINVYIYLSKVHLVLMVNISYALICMTRDIFLHHILYEKFYTMAPLVRSYDTRLISTHLRC